MELGAEADRRTRRQSQPDLRTEFGQALRHECRQKD
jgi:hypothetical protein